MNLKTWCDKTSRSSLQAKVCWLRNVSQYKIRCLTKQRLVFLIRSLEVLRQCRSVCQESGSFLTSFNLHVVIAYICEVGEIEDHDASLFFWLWPQRCWSRLETHIQSFQSFRCILYFLGMNQEHLIVSNWLGNSWNVLRNYCVQKQCSGVTHPEIFD